MAIFHPNDILTGGETFQEYNENLLKDLIEMLNERKFNIILYNSDFECDQIEEWFGTEYKTIGSLSNFWIWCTALTVISLF